jgi:hypothetical protein
MLASRSGDPVLCIAVRGNDLAVGYASGKVVLQHPQNEIVVLRECANEGVRALWIDEIMGVEALYGDIAVQWRDLREWKRMQCSRYAEEHVIVAAKGKYAVRMARGRSGVNIIDLERMEQEKARIDTAGMEFAIPVYWDGSRLVVAQNSDYVDQVAVQVWKRRDDDDEWMEKIFEKRFDKKKRSYWGFQLNPNGTKMVIVSLHCKLSIWDIQLGKKNFNFQAYGWGASIVAYLVEENSEELVIYTIGSNSKLKIWNGSKCIRKIKLEGSFQMLFPYCMYKSENRIIYSADEGVFSISI